MYLVVDRKRAAELIASFKQVAVDQTGEEKRNFKLKAYISEILRSLGSEARRRGISLRVTGASGIKLYSYPGALMQILTNLIMNSLHHGFENAKGGTIAIDFTEKGDEVQLRYRDDGSGMSESVRGRIFEPFSTTRRSQGGTGLGLHIVYNLVTRKLGGTIACESAPGKGTGFILQFPVRKEEED